MVPVAMVTLAGDEAMPLATTTSVLAPVSAPAGTSKFVDTVAMPVATPIELWPWRSEEHTSELQSHSDLVCRLLLEKKNRFTDLAIVSRRWSVYASAQRCDRLP